MPYARKAPARSFKRRPLRLTATKSSKAKAVEKVKVSNVKRIVKSVLKTNTELKFAMQNFIADKVEITGCGLNYNGTTQLNGWCSGPSNGYGIIPALSQGAGEGNRIGVKVSPKSCFLRYSLLARSTTDSTAAINDNPFKGIPFRVRVIVFRHKYAIDDFSQANIVNIGNSNTSLTADMDTYFRPYNKEEYTIVFSRTHKMCALRHITGTGYSTESVANGTLNFVSGRASIPLPKLLRYNDTVVTDYPTNVNYFMAIAIVNEDGSTVTTSQKRVTMSAESGMYFHDS